MPGTRDGLVSVSLGSTEEIGFRLIAVGGFVNLSEACRARLAALGEAGMASGVDDTFDIDAFVEDARANG